MNWDFQLDYFVLSSLNVVLISEYTVFTPFFLQGIARAKYLNVNAWEFLLTA